MLYKKFEVYGFDNVTGQKKTIHAQSSDIAGVKEQLRKAMPNFVILAIYPSD